MSSWTGKEFSWDSVSKKGLEALPFGLYGFLVSDASLGDPTKKKPNGEGGDPQISVELKITNKHGEEVGSLNRKCFSNLVFVPGGMFRIKQIAESLGVALPPFPFEDDALQEFAEALVAADSSNATVLLGQRKDPKDPSKVYNDPKNFFTPDELKEFLESDAAKALTEAVEEDTGPKRRKKGEKAA